MLTCESYQAVMATGTGMSIEIIENAISYAAEAISRGDDGLDARRSAADQAMSEHSADVLTVWAEVRDGFR